MNPKLTAERLARRFECHAVHRHFPVAQQAIRRVPVPLCDKVAMNLICLTIALAADERMRRFDVVQTHIATFEPDLTAVREPVRDQVFH